MKKTKLESKLDKEIKSLKAYIRNLQSALTANELELKSVLEDRKRKESQESQEFRTIDTMQRIIEEREGYEKLQKMVSECVKSNEMLTWNNLALNKSLSVIRMDIEELKKRKRWQRRRRK